MAPHKQTAKQSTGAPAPRKTLGFLAVGGIAFRTDTDVASNVSVPPTLAVKKDTHNTFCSGCFDGGDVLYLCNGPGCSKVACNRCVPDLGKIRKANVYICITCHLTTQRRHKGPYAVPYHAFVSANDFAKPVTKTFTVVRQNTRSVFPDVNTASLAIVSISLAGMKMSGSPGVVLGEMLNSYYDNAGGDNYKLFKYSIDFDFGKRDGIETYSIKIVDVVRDLERVQPERIIVFLTTHSTPDTGLLHIVPGDKGAAPVSEVLSHLLPPALREVIAKKRAVLFLMVCGGAYLERAAWSTFNELARRTFTEVFAFPTARFQPHQSLYFILMFVERVFIEGQGADRILNILHDNPQFGVHTDVVLLGRKQGDNTPYFKRFVWIHHVRRPWGVPTPLQCPKCGVLQSIRVSQVNITFEVRLRHGCTARLQGKGREPVLCGWVNDVRVPKNMAVLGRGEKGAQGNWVMIQDATEDDFIKH